MIYLDTSALLKRYHEEAGSDWIRRVSAGAPALATASLTYAEFFSALHRKLREEGLNPATYSRLAEDFEADWLDLEVIPLSGKILRAARHIIERHQLRAGDAVQLASALTISATVPAYFMSADRRLTQAAEREGLNTL